MRHAVDGGLNSRISGAERGIQAGIEALDSELLRLMRKGSTLIANVQLLKLAAEEGIYVEWLALHGFPNEPPDAYGRTAALIPNLLHLQPPSAFLRVRADRFSPYFADPAAFGVTLEPLPAYNYLFPHAPGQIADLAYHFRMRSAALDDMDDYVAPAAAAYAAWQRQQSASTLRSEEQDGVLWIHEGRAGRPVGSRSFTGTPAAVLRACGQAMGWRQLQEQLGNAPALTRAVEALQADGLLLRERDLLLTLALRPAHPGQAPSAAAARRLALGAGAQKTD